MGPFHRIIEFGFLLLINKSRGNPVFYFVQKSGHIPKAWPIYLKHNKKGGANNMAKIQSTTKTNEVIIADTQEAEALAAMLEKYGINVVVVK
jgi:hypothetical protein